MKHDLEVDLLISLPAVLAVAGGAVMKLDAISSSAVAVLPVIVLPGEVVRVLSIGVGMISNLEVEEIMWRVSLAYQVTLSPPSTVNTWPVIQVASGDASATIQPATSSGTPRLPSGMRARSLALTLSICSADNFILSDRKSLSVGPAATAFTRMPSDASSSAQHLVICSSAALLAA